MPHDGSTAERRATPRYRLDLPHPGTLNLVTPVRVVEVGPAGVRIELGSPLLPEQACILDGVGPEAALHLRARVRWCQPSRPGREPAGGGGSYRAGLRLLDPPAAVRTKLLQLAGVPGIASTGT